MMNPGIELDRILNRWSLRDERLESGIELLEQLMLNTYKEVT